MHPIHSIGGRETVSHSGLPSFFATNWMNSPPTRLQNLQEDSALQKLLS
jgi:hypothetical protein